MHEDILPQRCDIYGSSDLGVWVHQSSSFSLLIGGSKVVKMKSVRRLVSTMTGTAYISNGNGELHMLSSTKLIFTLQHLPILQHPPLHEGGRLHSKTVFFFTPHSD